MVLLCLEGFLFVYGIWEHSVDSYTKLLLRNEDRLLCQQLQPGVPLPCNKASGLSLMALLNCGDVIPMVGLALELWWPPFPMSPPQSLCEPSVTVKSLIRMPQPRDTLSLKWKILHVLKPQSWK